MGQLVPLYGAAPGTASIPSAASDPMTYLAPVGLNPFDPQLERRGAWFQPFMSL
jgi:hypothetical protein